MRAGSGSLLYLRNRLQHLDRVAKAIHQPGMRLVSNLRGPKPPPYRVSFDAPFTRKSLTELATALPQNLISYQDTYFLDLDNFPERPKSAAVLIALCNVDEKPGLILEVRGKLRTHSGEISFPGGKVDSTDLNLIDAALRETKEEIGIRRRQIQILGRLLPTVPSLHGLDVHCFVGFLHAPESLEISSGWAFPDLEIDTNNADQVLPSLDMSQLRRSPEEVSQIFFLPLSYLVDPARLRQHRLPNRPPYHAIDVTDLIDKSGDAMLPPAPWEGEDEVGSGGDPDIPKVEVWGLTGWYLNQLMRRLGAY